ncbi:MAG: eukaryotic-like serine/threonine-protein kinase [Blastocatellia bacterium]|jgi:serine/threonine protein kinase/Tfp pilus assembly protein PilF|nr:eukaryotic-like serine/threonine-protein kinase [Blastocatellia bacterium]
MTPERWHQVKELFDSTLQCEPEQRSIFLSRACGEDESLRREVESLLASHEKDGSFIDSPAYQAAAEMLASDLELKAGQTIGRYEIRSKLGAGGMGEVYLAEDTQLGRGVAIKFLPPEAMSDERAKKRLIREARAAATLDHPHICSVYEIGEADGRSFIAMQYIEGETLDVKLKRKPLELKESLTIAAQIAEALTEAHSHGIIHRDIKPQNIMLTARGQVKVLDFGLAKVMRGKAISDYEAETATLLTQAGAIVGTVPYMSPEQVRAEELDGRSDIFSYGVVIYELISGRRPFDAKSSAEIISAILTQDPPPLRGIATNRFERLVRKCLEKELAKRYQTMEELIVELEQVKRECESGQFATLIKNGAVSRPRVTDTRRQLNWRSVFSSRLALAAIVLLTLALALAMYVRFLRGPTLATKPNIKYENSPAYDSYLRGKINVKSENRDDIENAIRLLKQAIAADSDFAPAYSELARAYNIKAFYFAPEAEKKQLNEDAAVAVEKALALDPNLAEAHFSRGLILWTHENHFPHEQAIQAYRRAVELDPNLDEAHLQLGVVYFHTGLLDKGQSELEKALAINPGNTLARTRLGVIDLYRGKYEDAYRVFSGTPLKSNPSLLIYQTATALFRLDRIEEANDLIDKFLKDYPKDEGGAVTSVKAMMLAKAGKTKEAEDTIQRAIEIGKGFGHFHHTAYNIASAYALMNQAEPAIKWLQVAADDGLPCYPLFAQDSNLDSLRKDEHFIAFMTKLKQQWEHYQATL